MATESFNIVDSAQLATDKVIKMIKNGLPADQFKNMNIEATSYAAHFGWEKVFATAASVGNIDIMMEIDARREFVSQDALNQALEALIDTRKDDRRTAHWLVMMGANPAALNKDGDKLYMQAWTSGQSGIFTEIATWSPDLKISNTEQPMIRHSGGAFLDAMNVYFERTAISHAGTKDVRSAYTDSLAQQDFTRMAAAYTESKNSYFGLRAIRGEVKLKTDNFNNVGDGILLALSKGETEFALQMVRDGISANDVSKTATFNLLPKLSEPARKLYDSMKECAVITGEIPSASQRRTVHVMRMLNYPHPFRG